MENKKSNITNVLGWISLVVSLLMFLAWLYKSVFEDKELIGLEAHYIYYTFGASVLFFLMPDEWIKNILKKGVGKIIGNTDEGKN